MLRGTLPLDGRKHACFRLVYFRQAGIFRLVLEVTWIGFRAALPGACLLAGTCLLGVLGGVTEGT
jgi:hypothetical protein